MDKPVFRNSSPKSSSSLKISPAAAPFGGFKPAPVFRADTSGGLFSFNTSPRLFGGAFGQEPKGTGHVKYKPVVGTDTDIVVKYHCITFMREYENKSLEELRLEDYTAGRKGGGGGGVFERFTKPLFWGLNERLTVPPSPAEGEKRQVTDTEMLVTCIQKLTSAVADMQNSIRSLTEEVAAIRTTLEARTSP